MSFELKNRINELTKKLINTSIFEVESNPSQASIMDELLQTCIEDGSFDHSSKDITDFIETVISDSFSNNSDVDHAMNELSTQLKFNEESFENTKSYLGAVFEARSFLNENPELTDFHIEKTMHHSDILASHIEAGIIQKLRDYGGYAKGVVREKRASLTGEKPSPLLYSSEYKFNGSEFEELLQYSDLGSFITKKDENLTGVLKIQTSSAKEPILVDLDFAKPNTKEIVDATFKESLGSSVFKVHELRVDFKIQREGFNTFDFSKYSNQTTVLITSLTMALSENDQLSFFPTNGKLSYATLKPYINSLRKGFIVSADFENAGFSKKGTSYDVKIQVYLKRRNKANPFKFWISSIFISMKEVPSSNNPLIQTEIASETDFSLESRVFLGSVISDQQYEAIMDHVLGQHQVMIEGLFSDFLKRIGIKRASTTRSQLTDQQQTVAPLPAASSSSSPPVPLLPLKPQPGVSSFDFSEDSTFNTLSSPRAFNLSNLTTVSTSSANREKAVFVSPDSLFFERIFGFTKNEFKNAQTNFKLPIKLESIKIINTRLISRSPGDNSEVLLKDLEEKNHYAVFSIDFSKNDSNYKKEIAKKWKWVSSKKGSFVAIFPKSLDEFWLWRFNTEALNLFDVEITVGGKTYSLRTILPYTPKEIAMPISVFQFPVVGDKTISIVLNDGKLYCIFVQETNIDLNNRKNWETEKDSKRSHLPFTMVVYDAMDESIRVIMQQLLKTKIQEPSSEFVSPLEKITISPKNGIQKQDFVIDLVDSEKSRWEWKGFQKLENIENIFFVKPKEGTTNLLFFNPSGNNPDVSELNNWIISLDYSETSKSRDHGSFKINFTKKHMVIAGILDETIHFFTYITQKERSERINVYEIKGLILIFNKGFKQIPTPEKELVFGRDSKIVFVRDAKIPVSKFGPNHLKNLNQTRMTLPRPVPASSSTSQITKPEEPASFETPSSSTQETQLPAPELSESENSERTVDVTPAEPLTPPTQNEMTLSPPIDTFTSTEESMLPSTSTSSFSSSSPKETVVSEVEEIESKLVGSDLDQSSEEIDLSQLDDDLISSFL